MVKVQNAYVPTITYQRIKQPTDNSRVVLGYYDKGFWQNGGVASLPFLDESFKGYKSPALK